MSIEVDQSTLQSLRRTLDSASTDLEGTAGSAPGSVDAGAMSAVINGLLSKLAESAGELSTGLMAASAGVAGSAEDYWITEDSVSDRFNMSGPR